MTSLYYSGWRSRKSNGLSRMIILSFFIHLTLLLLAVFFPLRNSTPRFTLGPVYSVRLVGVSESQMTQRQASQSLPGLEGSSLPTAARVIKKAVTVRSTPIKRVETQQSSRNKAIEDLKKRLGERAAAGNTGAASSASSAAGGEINDRLGDYYQLIWARIKGQWALPGGINPRNNIEAVVNIRILKSGAIAGMNFEKKSGLAYFDNSVIRALKKAHPLPPLPEWYREDNLEIGIRFLSSELRNR